MYIYRIIILCFFFNMAYSLVGITVWSWGTTSDEDGVATTMVGYDTSCILCGVSGDLSKGQEIDKGGCGDKALRSEASTLSDWETNTWRVRGHGGRCGSVWNNNPVNAQATCFKYSASIEGTWTPDKPSVSFIKYFPIQAGRQCFLSGIYGVDGSWINANTYARIRKVTTVDPTHPTPGWYIESNLQNAPSGSRPMIKFSCIDFPANHFFTSGTTQIKSTTQTINLTTGTGVKACGLTGIQGAFNVNSWTDGVIMNFPTSSTGDWSLTVSPQKSASWLCVK